MADFLPYDFDNQGNLVRPKAETPSAPSGNQNFKPYEFNEDPSSTFNSVAGTLATSLNKGVLSPLGNVYDIARAPVNAGIAGINAATGSNIPYATSGQGHINDALNATVGTTQPQNQLERNVAAAGTGAGDAMGTAMGGGLLRAAGMLPRMLEPLAPKIDIAPKDASAAKNAWAGLKSMIMQSIYGAGSGEGAKAGGDLGKDWGGELGQAAGATLGGFGGGAVPAVTFEGLPTLWSRIRGASTPSGTGPSPNNSQAQQQAVGDVLNQAVQDARLNQYQGYKASNGSGTFNNYATKNPLPPQYPSEMTPGQVYGDPVSAMFSQPRNVARAAAYPGLMTVGGAIGDTLFPGATGEGTGMLSGVLGTEKILDMFLPRQSENIPVSQATGLFQKALENPTLARALRRNAASTPPQDYSNYMKSLLGQGFSTMPYLPYGQ